ncbi:MAG: helix-turn-helix transcriptional regulator [Clostridia bacterium]|nr:helix-turn-helix transcriptional regulator [Clostridia bacterium]
MTDTKALKDYMTDTGMTVKAIADKSGILRETLYNRLKSGDFKLSEINALVEVLRMTPEDRDRIFFAENSELDSRRAV